MRTLYVAAYAVVLMLVLLVVFPNIDRDECA